MRHRLSRLLWLPLLLCGLAVISIPITVGQDLSANALEPPPIVDYVVAMPRAAIVPPPAPSTEPMPPYGAACNFPRNHGGLTIPVGTVVAFREAPDIEGVWYPRTYGHLGTSLELQMRAPNSSERKWITLGRDGARATRFGPSIGTADVGVPHRFVRPGVHILRAIVTTVAIPMDPNTDTPVPAVEDCPTAAKDRSVVYIRVHVVDGAVDVSATTAEPSDDAVLEMEADDENTSEQ